MNSLVSGYFIILMLALTIMETTSRLSSTDGSFSEPDFNVIRNPTKVTCQKLSESILCFELVRPEIRELYGKFEETRRTESTKSETTLRIIIHFTAFQKRIRLHMHRILESDVLPSITVIKSLSSAGEKSYFAKDLNLKFFQGSDVSDSSSYAHGTILNGEFDGTIKTEEEVYYVEPAWKYPEIGLRGDGMAVIYRRSDIKYPETSCRQSSNASFRLNRLFDSVFHEKSRTRRRRQKSSTNSRTCDLFILADHTFFQYSGLRSLETTVSEIVYHVTEADNIFRRTDFDGDLEGDDVGFRITQMNVVEDILAPHYNMRSMALDVEDYLNQFSRYNFEHFCLAVAFTVRDFSRGSIGLAFTAAPDRSGAPGGLCERRMNYIINGFFGLYSFNALVVSQGNNGQKLPRDVVSLTLTHELGHAFGSPHDDECEDRTCFPGQKSRFGNFIMFSLNAGVERPNNFRFSHCSRRFINPVIQNKGQCLVVNKPPVCGNMLVETAEECDCGTSHTCEKVDRCCTPHSVYTGILATDAFGCKLARDKGSQCSPRSKLCCDDDCRITASSKNVICRQGTECVKEAKCDGYSDSCPFPVYMPDATPCAEGSGKCMMGKCSVSVCQMNGLVDCSCTIKGAQCRVCCACALGSHIHCIPADWMALTSGFHSFHLPEYPCDNGRGKCNQDGLCWSLSTGRRKRFLEQDHLYYHQNNQETDLASEIFKQTNSCPIIIWYNFVFQFVAISCLCLCIIN